jgi:phosphate transport system protein
MTRRHIVRSYDEELDQLKSKIRDMGRACGEQLQKALEALINRDHDLVTDTIQGDEYVDNLEREVNDLTVQILARRQPMALDLRHIISGLKIAGDLERIADYATNIAKHVPSLNHISLEEPLQSIIRMGKLAKAMLEEVMAAYLKADAEQAVETWHRDREMDGMYADLLNQLRSFMSEDVENIKAYTSLLFVARCCERIGDHITNVAESVYFMEKGEVYGEISQDRGKFQ